MLIFTCSHQVQSHLLRNENPRIEDDHKKSKEYANDERKENRCDAFLLNLLLRFQFPAPESDSPI